MLYPAELRGLKAKRIAFSAESGQQSYSAENRTQTSKQQIY
jgi:hypothetical protein